MFECGMGATCGMEVLRWVYENGCPCDLGQVRAVAMRVGQGPGAPACGGMVRSGRALTKRDRFWLRGDDLPVMMCSYVCCAYVC